MRLPTFDDVAAASERLTGVAVHTPLIESSALNARVGARILIKPENLQRMGAFKFRGAYNAISRLDREKWPGGVATCSSGNHAGGVAEAARLCGIAATIVMPEDAPENKLARTRAAGAEIITYDRQKEDREAIAAEISKDRGACYISPYDHPDIIAGQGTAGLELMRQARALGAQPDCLIAPCGGGGLIAGLALAVRHLSPGIEVYAVEPEGFDDHARSLASGRREKNAALSGSICDALLAPMPGELTFQINAKALSGALSVSDDEARDAIRFAFNELKLVLEPGGAVALAALLNGRMATKDRTIALILSGGNIDGDQFAGILAA
ncbi:phenylserine dehydratase [bacterium BMS3Bbin10]|nr:phenylserine dehydratase [bacterium BMS3Bbin10]HDL16317.1 threonine/serine dehydratase [Hyphomicrobiales bacterium]